MSMKVSIEEMFLGLYRLHRKVMATGAYSQLVKTQDGVTLTINEFGINFPEHSFTYRLLGEDAREDEEEYRKAADHLAEVLGLRNIA